MSMNQSEFFQPLRSVVLGSLIALGLIFILTTVLAVMTEFGWTGTMQPFRDNVYMLVVYIGIVVGAVLAARRSKVNGWLTGIGVGVLSSFILLVLTVFTGETVNWGVFAVKTLISGAIGVFGGIIGVNFIR